VLIFIASVLVTDSSLLLFCDRGGVWSVNTVPNSLLLFHTSAAVYVFISCCSAYIKLHSVFLVIVHGV